MSKHQIDGGESSHFNFAGGNVHLVSSQEDWEGKLSEANREGKIILANFSASWCGPCKLIAPYYAELSEKYPSLMFLLIDVDEMTDLSTSYDIKATPSIFFLKNGEQISKLVGCNKPELLKKITAVLDSQPESSCLQPQPQ